MLRIIEFSENLLQNTKGGVVAGIGILFLFWTVIKVLGNIETSFNDIWGVKKERSIGRKFTDYLSLMLIAPLIFLVGSSLSVFVISHARTFISQWEFLGAVGPVLITSLKILTYAVFWGLLTYLYMFLPNTRIQFKSALIGGVIAGTAYQFVQWGYIYFQVGVSRAGAIYGSFAALPLFLMWLQISWLIVLYGCELAFAHQNEKTFEFEPDCMNVSYATRKLLALRIVQLCVRRFSEGKPGMSAEEIANQLEMPVRLARDIIFQLCTAGLLAALEGSDEKDRRYQPARDVSDMDIQFVIEKMEKQGSESVPVARTAQLETLRESLEAFDAAMRQLPANRPLKEISRLPEKAGL